MPNWWCANRVAFSHSDTDMIGRVATAITTGLFSDFLPCDDPDNWPEWNCQHWGTKWDVKLPQTKVAEYLHGQTTIELSFDTAWAPPTAFYEHMESLGFTVSADYYEPGWPFCGTYHCGENVHYDIQGNADWVRNNIPEEINNLWGIADDMDEWEQDTV